MTNSQHPYLLVRRGPNPDKSFPLTEETCIVGREPINDVVLADPEVSRRHARLVLKHGAYHIEDLSSTNGTYINGRRISSLTPLAHGDVIDFGETIRVVFNWPPDEAATMVGGDRLKSVPKKYTDSAIFDTSIPFPVPPRKETTPLADSEIAIGSVDDAGFDYVDDDYADAETISELSGPVLSPLPSESIGPSSMSSEPVATPDTGWNHDQALSSDTPSRRNLWIGVGCGVLLFGACSCGSLLVFLDATNPDLLYSWLPF